MKKRILVVDDDKLILKIIEMNLSRAGYEVFTVEKGMEAISFLKNQDVDLILLDIEMPIVSGMKTLELIRKKPEMADIPVIFLTASAERELVIEACRLEAADYVVKPCVPSELINRIEKTLNS